MKWLKHALWILPLLTVTMVMGWRLWIWNSWRADYAEAERLVKVVWPMAESMKEFRIEHGRIPASLDELAEHDPDFDFTPLSSYEVTLSPEGAIRFHVQVNPRFALAIDEQGRPFWAQTTATGR